VWSFGCVLYEMLRRNVRSPGTRREAVAAVLEREPVWQALPAEAPPKAVDLLKRCLQKDRNRRLHDIADGRASSWRKRLPEPAPVVARRGQPPGAAGVATLGAWGRAPACWRSRRQALASSAGASRAPLPPAEDHPGWTFPSVA